MGGSFLPKSNKSSTPFLLAAPPFFSLRRLPFASYLQVEQEGRFSSLPCVSPRRFSLDG